MVPPMSLTSEQANGESSQISSMDSQINNNNNHQSDTSPRHHLLGELHELAKQDAQKQQAEKKNRKPRKSLIKKTKRQVSNIRSAEVCRAAKTLYIERLETAIFQAEEDRLRITKEMFDTTTAIVELEKKIQALEEKKGHMQQAETNLWMSKCCEESSQTDVPDDVFFRVSNEDDEMKWQFQNPTMSYVSDDWEEDVMFIGEEEVDVQVAPPCNLEDTTATTREDKMFTEDTCITKCVRSPVSVFDVVPFSRVQEVRGEEFVWPGRV